MAYFHSLQFSRNFFIFFIIIIIIIFLFFAKKKKIYIYSFSSPSISRITVNGILNKIFNLSFPSVRQRWRVAPWNMRFFFFFVTERQALNSPWSTAITDQYYRVRTFDVHVHVSIIVSCLKQTLWSTLATKNIRKKRMPFLSYAWKNDIWNRYIYIKNITFRE